MDKSKNRPRLGRGMSSLISVTPPPEPSKRDTAGELAGDTADSDGRVTDLSGQVAVRVGDGRPPSLTRQLAPLPYPMEIDVNEIRPNPHQPRRSFDEAALGELAASLKTAGLIQPIIVRRVGDTFELIAGERRLRAAKMAGLSAIPALVREHVDAVTQAQMALIENIQREDLNPMDRAEGYQVLVSQLGLTQGELAGRLGESRVSIAHYMRLLDLAEPVRQMVRDGRLSIGHGKVLAGVLDSGEQERIAQLVVSQDLSVRNIERLIEKGGAVAEKPAGGGGKPAVSAHIVDLERTLARELGMRVQLHSNAKSQGKGRLVVHYANLDQFDQLLGKLGVKLED